MQDQCFARVLPILLFHIRSIIAEARSLPSSIAHVRGKRNPFAVAAGASGARFS
jgi:hypothetical protein